LAANNDFVYIDALVAAGIIGVAGGIIGSFFIRTNNFVNVIRKKMLGTSKPKKVIEACILVVVTVSVFFATAFFRDENAVCRSIENQEDALIKVKFDVIQFSCPDGYYHRLATLLFSRQAEVLKIFMTKGNNFL
jgi:hypothetical protein